MSSIAIATGSVACDSSRPPQARPCRPRPNLRAVQLLADAVALRARALLQGAR
jgi:hypothetical protein